MFHSAVQSFDTWSQRLLAIPVMQKESNIDNVKKAKRETTFSSFSARPSTRFTGSVRGNRIRSRIPPNAMRKMLRRERNPLVESTM